jgi:arylsulfatase A-like enzyme
MLHSVVSGATALFFEVFHQAESLKSGMHHPDGMLWIRLPDRGHAVIEEKVSLLSVAPTVLSLLGMPIPAWMTGTSLLAPSAGSGVHVVATPASGGRPRS